jgi:hypothetical protein
MTASQVNNIVAMIDDLAGLDDIRQIVALWQPPLSSAS